MFWFDLAMAVELAAELIVGMALVVGKHGRSEQNIKQVIDPVVINGEPKRVRFHHTVEESQVIGKQKQPKTIQE